MIVLTFSTQKLENNSDKLSVLGLSAVSVCRYDQPAFRRVQVGIGDSAGDRQRNSAAAL